MTLENVENEYDDVLYGPGFIMARKGRHILMESSKTKEEHQAILRTLFEARGEMEESIQSQARDLEALIKEYDPIDIIANVSLRNSIWNTDDYKEYESLENPAFVEYITLLCLSNQHDDFNHRNPQPIPPSMIEDIQKRLQELFISQSLFLGFKDINPDNTDPPDRLSRLCFESLLRSLIVRYPIYHHHLIDLLNELFFP